jgi:nucleoside-diphosphate-sugar epimerase
MVFEEAKEYPTPETAIKNTPPPASTYGFSKLATEYFCKGAYEQYGLPYSIVRPFNCVGVGEDKALGDDVITSGNVELMLSHVLPDLVNKCLKGQDPLHILGEGSQIRCYTNGKDLARGIRLVMESEKAVNNHYNISTPVATSVLDLAKIVWSKINPNKKFKYVSDKAFEYDVQMRIPDVSKAKNELGFEAEVSLEESVEEVIQHMIKNEK